MSPDTEELTLLLRDCARGDSEAFNRLVPHVYEELRRLAGRYMRSESPEHTLQPTALVHEAYTRLVGAEIEWRDRRHFFRAAALAMRRILVDHARRRASLRRGGEARKVPLDTSAGGGGEWTPDLLDLDRALGELFEQDERKGRVVELHFFAGLTYEEVGEVLQISPATVDRDMKFARAWIRRRLEGGEDDRGR